MSRARGAVAALGLLALALLAAPGLGAPAPAFRTYYAPASAKVVKGGEPSVTVNPRTGAVLYQSWTQLFRVSAFDAKGPGTARWVDVSAPGSGASLDPMLETDAVTGRTFVSQLTASCSDLAYSDDDGGHWTKVQVGCSLAAGVDHQTIATGPFAAGSPAASLGGQHRAVYYCSSTVLHAGCGVSTDGGASFGPASPATTLLDCYGNSGHLRVGPDSRAYLPLGDCPNFAKPPFDADKGVAWSADSGLTWTTAHLPGSHREASGDPSLAIGADGTLYVTAGLLTGQLGLWTSHDRGISWQGPSVVAAARKHRNVRFPALLAGGPGQLAVAYLATTTPGDASKDPAFRGAWHLLLSRSSDAGATWSTTDLTPTNPVQVGAICTEGTSCAQDRNLLDFIDSALGPDGRPLVAWTDGCTKPRCTAADRESVPALTRVLTGPPLR